MKINPQKLQKSLEKKSKQIKYLKEGLDALQEQFKALSDRMGVSYRKQGIFNSNDTFVGVRMVCVKKRGSKLDEELINLEEDKTAEMSERMKRAYSNINGQGGF